MDICADAGMTLPVYVSEREGVVWLSVKAQPRSKKNEIVGAVGAELKVRVTAPPVDSAANEALVHFLSDVLHCSRRQVSLARGASSTHKLFRIEGMAPGLAAQLIQAAMVR